MDELFWAAMTLLVGIAALAAVVLYAVSALIVILALGFLFAAPFTYGFVRGLRKRRDRDSNPENA